MQKTKMLQQQGTYITRAKGILVVGVIGHKFALRQERKRCGIKLTVFHYLPNVYTTYIKCNSVKLSINIFKVFLSLYFEKQFNSVAEVLLVNECCWAPGHLHLSKQMSIDRHSYSIDIEKQRQTCFPHYQKNIWSKFWRKLSLALLLEHAGDSGCFWQ